MDMPDDPGRARDITEVDVVRWEEAQRYEHRVWMGESGLNAREDRNKAHERAFSNYAVIRGERFENAIEIGCGPFTRHDPHSEVRSMQKDYPPRSAHKDRTISATPIARHRRKRLGGWPGVNVQTIAMPIENLRH